MVDLLSQSRVQRTFTETLESAARSIDYRRRRRPAALFFALQSAENSIVSDFTLGADCMRLWTSQAPVDLSVQKSLPGPWMTTPYSEDETSRYPLPERPKGRLTMLATPEALRLLLRSNWGAYGSGTFTLEPCTPAWGTLAWVEELGVPGSVQNLVRIWNCYPHNIRIVSRRAEGRVLIQVNYGAGRVKVDPLNNLPVEVVLPAAHTPPTDQRVFNVRHSDLILDPTGMALSINYTDLVLEIDQKAVSSWYMSDKWEVYKGGLTHVNILFGGVVNLETWQVLNDARADTKRRLRLTMTAPGSPSSVFTAEIYCADFAADPIGHDARGWIAFRCNGRALVRASDDKFVDLSLS